MPNSEPKESDHRLEPPYPSESLLIEALPRLTGRRLLCTSLGRAQFAAAFLAEHPDAQATCNYLDLHQAQRSREANSPMANLRITCEADLPEGDYDLAALPFTSSGDAELTRELLQEAHQRLAIGGMFVASTNNPADSWLGDELNKLFAKVRRHSHEQGVVYEAVKTQSLKKVKNYACEFAFRDGERLLKAFSRPGVFSHRKVDTGARAMTEVMQVSPGQRVFEIGCGSGVVSLAAAARSAGRVLAIDSNPRAVECTRRGADLNGLSNVVAELNATGDCDEPGTYDIALANPPYYSHFKIAAIFLDGAYRALKPGGRVYVVTKHPAWYQETMPSQFRNVELIEHRGYVVLTGEKRA